MFYYSFTFTLPVKQHYMVFLLWNLVKQCKLAPKNRIIYRIIVLSYRTIYLENIAQFLIFYFTLSDGLVIIPFLWMENFYNFFFYLHLLLHNVLYLLVYTVHVRVMYMHFMWTVLIPSCVVVIPFFFMYMLQMLSISRIKLFLLQMKRKSFLQNLKSLWSNQRPSQEKKLFM